MPQNSFQLTNGSPLKNSFIITPYPQKEQKTLNISLWLVARTFLAFDSSKSWYFINITSSPHRPPPCRQHLALKTRGSMSRGAGGLWETDSDHFSVVCFWSWPTAYGILVSRPGIEPRSPALKAQSRNHWATRQVPWDSDLEGLGHRLTCCESKGRGSSLESSWVLWEGDSLTNLGHVLEEKGLGGTFSKTKVLAGAI